MSAEVKKTLIYIGLLLWSAIWMFVAAWCLDQSARMRRGRWKIARLKE